MMNRIAVVFILLLSCVSHAQDWSELPWRSGQILGFSSRAGLTPVVVQLGTLSQVDHVAIVSVETDGPWLYEFTNDSGIQKIKLPAAWARAADLQGKVHFVLGEFAPSIASQEWLAVKEKLDDWVSRKDPNPPSNCLETVVKAFKGIRKLHIGTTSASAFIDSIGDLPLLKALQKTYPDPNNFPVIASLFEGLQRPVSNISNSMMWTNEQSFVSKWQAEGDLGKFVRSTQLEISEFAEKVRLRRTNSVIRHCEALF